MNNGDKKLPDQLERYFDEQLNELRHSAGRLEEDARMLKARAEEQRELAGKLERDRARLRRIWTSPAPATDLPIA